MKTKTSIIPTRYGQVLNAAVRAYADCNNAWRRSPSGPSTCQDADAVRKLDWRAEHTLDATQFKRVVRAALDGGTYNEFDAIGTANLLASLAPNARFRFARENSVCVYVERASPEAVARIREAARVLRYDECDADHTDASTLRLWWD